jgi:hypothetical protein
MAIDHDIDADEPDLAQLLVLEAGRMLEDLTPKLANSLPEGREERAFILGKILNHIEATCLLARAASAMIDMQQA